MKKILLTSSALTMGGIETLIVRLASAWHNKNVQVSVLLLSRNCNIDLLDQLKNIANIYYLEDIIKPKFLYVKSLTAVNFFLPLSKIKVENILDEVDHIHFTDSFTMMFCMRLIKLYKHSIKISGGVYHQHEYSYGRMADSYYVRQLKNIFCFTIPQKNILFFNEISRKNLTVSNDIDYSQSTLLPIGIDISKYGMRNLNHVDRSKIVSIGSIINFKTYNFWFIQSLEKLKRRGLNFTYHVYGDGPSMEALQETISRSAIAQQVHLHGIVNYSDFKNTVSDAFLFIGSGTALIEAAACGVPALIGIESEESDQTYGFFHTMDGFSYHEKGIKIDTNSFATFCEQLYALDATEYAAECCKSELKAQEFSMDKMLSGFDAMHKNAILIKSKNIKFNTTLICLGLIFNRIFGRSNKLGFWHRYNFG